MGDIKFYSPVDFDDTSSGVTIEGDIQLGSFNKISGVASDNLVIAVDTGNTSGGSSIDFQIDGANSAMFINNSRNVGIGTTSPGSKLEVNGDITILDGNRLNVKSTGGTYTGYIEKDGYNGIIGLGNNTTFTSARRIYINDGTNQRWEFGGNSTAASDNIIAPGGGYTESSIYAGHLGNIGFFTRASTVAANVMQLFDRADNNNHGVKLIYKSGGTYSDGLVLDNTGNVGIGTTSPSTKLEVSAATSAITIRTSYPTDSSQRGALLWKDSTNITGAIDTRYDGSTVDMHFGSLYNSGYNSTTRLTIKGDGNVGIGTTSPSEKLEVAGAVGNFKTTGHQIFLTRNGNNEIYAVGASSVLALGQNGSEKMRIHSNGNVGIGTTSPSERLSVDGNAIVSGIGVGTSTLYSNSINITNSGTLRIGNAEFLSKSSNDLSIYQQKINVTSAGNVGIGTTSPGAKLDVKVSSANLTNVIKFGDATPGYLASGTTGVYLSDSSGNARIMFEHTGNVGIGTTSPSKKLHVAGSFKVTSESVFEGYIDVENTIYHRENIRVLNKLATNWVTWATRDTSGSDSVINLSNIGTITATGNVGIGTTSPAEKLTVSGDANVTGKFAVGAASVHGTYDFYNQLTSYFNGAMTVDASFTQTGGADSTFSGDVGIGTTSPGTALHIRGDNTSVARMLMIDQGSTGDASMSFRLAGLQEYAVGIDNSDGNRFKISNSSGVGTNDLLTIEPGGDVGIGTNNPESILHISDANPEFILEDTTNPNKCKIRNVDGSLIYDADYNSEFGNSRHRFFIDGSEKLRIEAGGNVGIGTTSPTSPLHVVNTVGGWSAYINNDVGTGTQSGLLLDAGSSSSDFAMYVRNAAGSSDLFSIKGNGNVGIGTPSPGQKLEVANGRIAVDSNYGFQLALTSATQIGRWFNSSGINYLQGDSTRSWQIGSTTNGVNTYFDNINNRVGIGTTSPDVKLHVSGNAKATNIYVADSIIHTGDTNNYFKFDTDTQIFATSGAERMRINSSGNVGIGTTNPAYKLTVAGDTYVFNSNLHLNSGYGIVNAGNTSHKAGFPSLGNFAFENVNVGIGTTSPASRFHIYQPSGATGFRLTRSNNITGVGLNITVDSSKNIISGYGGLTFRTATTGNGTNASEKMRIDTSGNVGIGTTNPTARLRVKGSGTTSSTTALLVENSSGTDLLKVTDDGKATFENGLILDGTARIFNGNTVWLQGNSQTGTQVLVKNDIGASKTSGNILYINKGGATTSSVNVLNAGNILHVKVDGNIGIGTTSPAYKLQVGDNGVADGNITMKANGTGIDAGAELTFNMTVGGGNADSHIAQIVPISYDSLSTGTHNSLNFKVGVWNNNADAGVSRMTILSNGNVGVGTTDPSNRLQVTDGSIGIDSQYAIRDNRNNTILQQSADTLASNRTLTIGNATYSNIIIPNGNVGIGTTSPQQKLDVVGYTRTTTLEANGLTGSINLGYGANFKGGLFNDQYLTGDPANSVNDFVTYAPYKYHITVGTATNKVITVDSSNNVDIDGNIHVTGTTRLDSGGGSQPGFLQNQTPVDAIVRSGGAPEVYLSEPDEWLTINIAGTDYVIPAYIP